MKCQMDILDYVNSLLSTEGENHVINYDMETGEWRGVIQTRDQVIQLKKGREHWEVMVADLRTKGFRILRGHGERIDPSVTPTETGITDLGTTGQRTEGFVVEGRPCGYSVVYDEEGRKVFEGFVAEGRSVCWGTEYYGDLDAIKYQGCYLYGMKHGCGTLRDRRGVIEYEGVWSEDSPSMRNVETVLESHAKSISLSSSESLFFELNSWMSQLESISIEDNALKRVRRFEVCGLPALRFLRVGKKSVTSQTEEFFCEGPMDGVCCITDCAKLTSLAFDELAFSDYGSLNLENLPSLLSLDFQDRCFNNGTSFTVRNLEKLRSIHFGGAVFVVCKKAVFENLPSLESVVFESCAFAGYRDEDEDESVIPTHTLTMRNLPLLRSIRGHVNFFEFGTVVLDTIPSLSLKDICFEYDSFTKVSSLTVIHAFDLGVYVATMTKLPVPFPTLQPRQLLIDSSVDCDKLLMDSSTDCDKLLINSTDHDKLLMDSSTHHDKLLINSSTDYIDWIVRSVLTKRTLRIPPGSSLKRLFIGSFTLRSLRRFELSQLNELELVKIGWNSFTRCDNEDMNKSSGGFFCIEECPRLKTIEIGEYSFSDFEHMEIRQLPSLETLHFEGSSFYYASSIDFHDLPLLRSLYCGTVTGYRCHAVSFRNLPRLETITLGYASFFGSEHPTNEDTVEWRDLPRLVSITGRERCFCHRKKVEIANVPALQTVRLEEGFQETRSARVKNSACFESYFRDMNVSVIRD